MRVETSQRDGIVTLVLSCPPVNGLSASMRDDLSRALDAAFAETSTTGILIAGANGRLSAGLDIAAYGDAETIGDMVALCDRIEAARVPVAILLDGLVSGAALSLALAAHFRVATPRARLAVTELQLGMIPCGGLTQRLPRLVGAQTALRLMLTAKAVRATDPVARPLVDHLAESDAVDEAVRFLAKKTSPRRTRDRRMGLNDPRTYLQSVRDIQSRMSDMSSPEGAALRTVEAALLLPFEQGVALESCLGAECRDAPRARAARHMAIVAQQARLPAHLSTQVTHPGRMSLEGEDGEVVAFGSRALVKGWTVEFRSEKSEELARRIKETLDRAVSRGKVAGEERDAALGRLALNGATADDGVITLYAGTPAPEGTVRLGLTMDTTIPALWMGTPHDDVTVAELSGPVSSEGDLARAAAFARSVCPVVIRSGRGAGCATRWLGAGYLAAAFDLRAMGWSETEIDGAAKTLGAERGPFEIMRRLGTDRAAGELAWFAECAGWRAPDDQASGDGPGIISPKRGLLGAMVNVVLHALCHRVVFRPADAEMLLVHLTRVEAARGGMLFQADEEGLLSLLRNLEALGAGQGSTLRPVPAWEAMVLEGRDFFARPFDFDAFLRTSE
ncbi:enoyl-CoA hydratase/isomerase family protein [Roseovarius sp. SCSIO 43702]|nr:enoyl-CoA hydratase/isomerase family protein [Roseovarius sp. SCSIO 43702]